MKYKINSPLADGVPWIVKILESLLVLRQNPIKEIFKKQNLYRTIFHNFFQYSSHSSPSGSKRSGTNIQIELNHADPLRLFDLEIKYFW